MSGNGGGSRRRPSSGQRPRSTVVSTPQSSFGSAGSSDPCDINEQTNLNSVNPPQLTSIGQGTILDVQRDQGPPEVLLARAHGQTIGSITSPQFQKILLCIKQGHVYKAKVINVQGANVWVEVYRI